MLCTPCRVDKAVIWRNIHDFGSQTGVKDQCVQTIKYGVDISRSGTK